MVAYALGRAVAPPLPPAIVDPWQGLRQTVTFEDGTEWDVSNPDTGVFLVTGELEGLGMPDVINWVTDSPVVHGVQWDGYLVPGRKVYWYVLVYSDQSNGDWFDLNAAWWRGLQPGKLIKWTVYLPGKRGTRTLWLRYQNSTPAYTQDPTAAGWAVHGIELFPEQPFWEGEPLGGFWKAADPVPFTGPNHGGPPFYVSREQTFATATLDNPGDVDTYVKWTTYGPHTSVELGVNGGKTLYNHPVLQGQVFDVETDPKKDLGARLDGVDVTKTLGSFQFRASRLPPGKKVRLSLAMTGPGAVRAEYRPLYWRCV